jgi:prepilin-type N-terminal cleavage/methylation domain-containing protein
VKANRDAGFTLIELIIVLVVLGFVALISDVNQAF